MPPMPAVSRIRPASDPAKCRVPMERSVSNVPWMTPWVPMYPPGREVMGPEDPPRHAGLDDERLVVLDPLERVHESPVRLPVPRALADAAVDDQPLGMLGVLHVVLEKAQDRLLLPALAAEHRAPLGAHGGEDLRG